jgi:hypothetical protein
VHRFNRETLSRFRAASLEQTKQEYRRMQVPSFLKNLWRLYFEEDTLLVT